MNQEQATILAREAAALIDRAVALVCQSPVGLEIMADADGDRTAAPRQNRLQAAIRVTGDQDAAAMWTRASRIWWAMAEQWRPLAIREARRWAPSPDAVEDLVSDGLIGAWEGARRYDPAQSSIMTYLLWWIRASIRRSADLETLIAVPEKVRDAVRQVSRGQRPGGRVRPAQLDHAAQVADRVPLEDVELAGGGPDPEAAALELDVERALAGAAPADVRIAALRLQGYTRAEVSAMLAISRKRIASAEKRVSALARARQAGQDV